MSYWRVCLWVYFYAYKPEPRHFSILVCQLWLSLALLFHQLCLRGFELLYSFIILLLLGVAVSDLAGQLFKFRSCHWIHHFSLLFVKWIKGPPGMLLSELQRNIKVAISVTKRQNGLLLHLAKMRYRALKFLVYFSTFLHTKMPQSQSKVVTQKG